MIRRRFALFTLAVTCVAVFGAVHFSKTGSPPAEARTTEVGALVQAPSASVWMSDVEDGERKRSLPADISEIWAVVDFEDAADDRFQVELQDLAGNTVVNENFPPVSGTDRESISITISMFVGSYLSAISEILAPTPGVGDSAMGLGETVEFVQTMCGVRPDLPDPWPPVLPTPNPPNPTPTAAPPDPYTQWLRGVLLPLEQAPGMSTELRRKLLALNALPDMDPDGPGGPAAAEFSRAASDLEGIEARLQEARLLIKPADPAIRPAPERACTIIDEAKVELDTALGYVENGQSAMPEDVSTWSFPTTEARYAGRTFLDCQQYLTSLDLITAGEPSGTTVDTESWTLGNPGPAALVFPSASLTDSGSVGTLRLSPTGGASAIYALGVLLEGLNHTATLGGHVTDRNCNPVDGHSMNFEIETESGGTISSSEVLSVDGDFSVQYTAPDDVPPKDEKGRRVDIKVSAKSADDDTIGATSQFNVIGKASNFRIIVNPKEINRLVPYVPPTVRPGFPTPTPSPRDPYSSGRLRGGITVEVKDLNGANVADLTSLTVKIKDGDPGLLAYERRVRGVVGTELVQAGKMIELITRGGNTVVRPELADPGITNLEGLYLIPGPDGDGYLTLEVSADGNRANSDDPEFAVKTIRIYSHAAILLPLVLNDSHPLPAVPEPTRPPR